MVYGKKDRENGYCYNNGSVRESIKKNEFVKNIRKKLMEERMKQKFS